MKPLRLIALFAFAACAPARTVPEAPAPAPAPAQQPQATPPAATPAPTPAPTATVAEPPRDWQLRDDSTDRVPGISALRAERELLAGKQPKRTVIVAVIDGGIDTAHVDLKANLWTNPKEVAGNGRDDDNNGYVDDVYGWNFIGGRDGKSVHHETLEVTRLYVRCTRGSAGTAQGTAPGATSATLPAPSAEECKKIAEDFEAERAETQQLAQQVMSIDQVLTRANEILRRAMSTDSLTADRVRAFEPRAPDAQQAKTFWLQIHNAGITPEALAAAKEEIESKTKYGLNPDFDPRGIVGDNYANTSERRYGNADVMGPDAKHGTHVAGIIGAVRGNNTGIDGIAPSVKLMMIRTVPDGDERDKDVANAIRYAAENGAHIINMSFGKGYSPEKAVVDAAVRYADSLGVLLVHAAGNDGENLAESPSFPTPVYASGGRPRNWIEVGASSWKRADSLVATFSNYGKEQVDVFAPGVDILSTVPGGGYERQSGTSMAAPVVSGLAALLMSYYPNLTATDVRRIILESATSHADQQVIRPGPPSERIPFGSLSVTGGIVNAYGALRMAEQVSATRQ